MRKRIWRVIAAALLATVGSTPALTAQDPPRAPAVSTPQGRPFALGALPFARGTPIRLLLSDGKLIQGPLRGSTADTIEITSGAGRYIVVPTSSVGALDYQLDAKGRRNRLITGFAVGGAVGGILGATIGAAVQQKSDCTPGSLCDSLDDLDRLANAATGLLIGGAVGGILGGVIGHQSGKQWKRYAIPTVRRS